MTMARMPPLSVRKPKRLVIKYAPGIPISLNRHRNGTRRRYPALPDGQRNRLTLVQAVRRPDIDLIDSDSARRETGIYNLKRNAVQGDVCWSYRHRQRIGRSGFAGRNRRSGTAQTG